ncbi:MAG: hypothetical protein R2685_08115 [Candidatus Nitrosocosmicus sp.]|nr:hypothetical protein [Candidatus Nitrosocosmicus sp.]
MLKGVTTKKYGRTSLTLDTELSTKLNILSDYYDRPKIRILRRMVNDELEKLPKHIQEVATR